MKRILFNLILFSTVIYGHSQNLLSPIWKYGIVNDFKEANNLVTGNWQDVNLLLSWERQGYCGENKHVIKNYFTVNKNQTDLLLEFSFAADVKAIYINQYKVTSNIPNSFWAERGKKNTVAIPDSILKQDSQNEVTVLFSYLSYTGGISHNFCSIHAAGAENKNPLAINFPTDNHVYLANNKKQFTIHSGTVSDNKLRIIIKNDFHDTLINELIKTKKGKEDYIFDFTKRDFKPGFYECVVISEGKTYSGVAEWFVIQPEDIACPIKKTPGFDEFWKNTLDELDDIAPNFKVTKVDSLCSTTRNGYVVEMNSLGNLTIRGYYFVPKTNGKHPVILHVPGYSYGFEYLDGFINKKGNIAELALCVRGHGISKDVFNPWDKMTLWAVGICNKDEYVYKGMYMDCVRAVEFLLQQPEIDNKKIAVEGGSQGGGLALATAGLCNSNIAACAIFDPWMCDFRHQAEIRTVVKSELESFSKFPSNNCGIDQMFSVWDFMDTKYFALDIKCPIYFSTALFDDDCPPHCGFSAYNNIKTTKSYKVYPNDSHLAESDQYADLFNFLEKVLLDK